MDREEQGRKQQDLEFQKMLWVCEHAPWFQTVTSARALPRGWGLSPRRVYIYEYLNYFFFCFQREGAKGWFCHFAWNENGLSKWRFTIQLQCWHFKRDLQIRISLQGTSRNGWVSLEMYSIDRLHIFRTTGYNILWRSLII